MDKESRKKLINKAVEEYITTSIEDRSLTQISKKYHIDRHTIAKELNKRGIEILTTNIKFKFNDTVFDSIDTEEKAYWLGFIFADGCIQSNDRRFSMSLSEKDIEHLQKFKNFINTKNAIHIVKDKRFDCNLCSIAVRSDHFWNSLNDKGCTARKSLTLKFPDISIFNNKSLIKDFIRGYCDGDGTIGIYERSRDKLYKLSMVGTLDFLNEVQKYIGIKGSIYKATYGKKVTEAVCLGYNSLKARQVARILYENSTIYLQRKYDIFKLFCQAEEESSRLKSSKIGEGWNANTEVSSEITKGSETP